MSAKVKVLNEQQKRQNAVEFSKLRKTMKMFIKAENKRRKRFAMREEIHPKMPIIPEAV